MRLIPPDGNEPSSPVNANNSGSPGLLPKLNPESSIKGVPQQAYRDAHRQVGKYLSVAYDEPLVSPSGNMHESSSIRIPAGTTIVNSRSTREGQNADTAARRGVYQQTGMHPGHDHPTQLGVDPSDTRRTQFRTGPAVPGMKTKRISKP